MRALLSFTCYRRPIEPPTPIPNEPPICTQVSVPSTLKNPGPYAAQELPELFPFAGSIFSSPRFADLFDNLFDNLAEPDDCAIAGQASSAASATKRKQLRIMPVFYRGQREGAT